MATEIFVILIVAVLVIAVLLILNTGKSHKPKSISKEKPIREGFKSGNDFYVYNYLLKPVRVVVEEPSGKETILISRLKPKTKHGLRISTIEKYLTNKNIIQVFILEGDDEQEPKHYASYNFDTPDNTTVKALHIGMITSRWVGADADYNIGKPGLNAVQGLPWIKIHNTTNQMLSLNNNINISPGGILRYTGRDHFGVRLGTIFKDVDGRFPEFIFTVPATDVYYGVVSDLQQSLFGGFQLTPDFVDGSDEPQYLLEEGWMGGPAYSKIPLGYLPIEGPIVPPTDRWGQPATKEQLETPVGPPFEKDTY